MTPTYLHNPPTNEYTTKHETPPHLATERSKIPTAQHDLLANAELEDWDIIALQEPYLDHLHLTQASPKWHIIYPSNKSLDGQSHMHSIILVNTNIHSKQISQIAIQSTNDTAIQFRTDSHTVIIINVYNDNMHSCAIDTISREWEIHKNTWLVDPSTKIIVLGDFNWHHSTWETRRNAHLTSQDCLLNPLLDLIVNMHLEMVLPRDIPTLEARNTGNWTCPDNVWRCADSPSPFITCNVRSGLQPVYTDHLPIVSTLDLTYTLTAHQVRFNFKEVDWDTFQERLIINLGTTLTTDLSGITDTATLEEGTNQLFKSITNTIQEVVPQAKISPHTKRWWNKELTATRRTRNRASTVRYRWCSLPDHPSHNKYRKISREYARAIESAKPDHWSEWIKHIGGNNIWSIHHYMRSNPTDYGKHMRQQTHTNQSHSSKR